MLKLKMTNFCKRPALILFICLVLFIITYDSLFLRRVDIPQGKQKYTGLIVENPELKDFGQQIILKLLNTQFPYQIKLTLSKPIEDLQKGDALSFQSKLSRPTSYNNPGVFDYSQYLLRKGIRASVFIDNEKQTLEIVSNTKNRGNQFREFFYQPTLKILTHLQVPLANQGLMRALLWGDESYLTEEVKTLFRTQGLYHLLVISGLHFTAITLVLFFLVTQLLRLVPRVYLYFPGKFIPSIVALCFLTIYFFLCYEGASITRAYLFSVVLFLAYLFRKNFDFLNLVFLLASIMLLINPFLLFDLSYQFSFLAVLSLVLIYPVLDERVFKINGEALLKKTAQIIRKIFLGTSAIFLGLTPLTLFNFHRLQPGGFFMNIWSVPFIEFFITPLLLLAFFLAPFLPMLAKPLFWISDYFLDWMLKILSWVQFHFPTEFSFYPPHFWELVSYYLILIILFSQFSRKIKTGTCVLGGFILLGSISFQAIDNRYHPYFRFTHLDVGQGDSLFLELPGGQNAFIDVGGGRYSDLATRVLVPFLEYRRISEINTLILTHDDLDHIGSALNLMDNIKIDSIWFNGKISETGTMKAIVAKANEKNIPLEIMKKGDLKRLNQCEVSVLSPDEELLQSAQDNDASLVLKWDCGTGTALFTGDISSKVEEKLIRDFGGLLKADYLKLAHHGSKNSNSTSFLQMVAPKLVSVSDKKGNHYHHPHPSVLDKLTKLNIPFYRTDQEGAIRFDFDQLEINVKIY
ncbi:MAG: hypothetical protein ACD_73C00590G0002 [uncultured bacterium]|nr:MAG: hypothetical protein ACD_73C00590G0002 [uncultured bacterium]